MSTTQRHFDLAVIGASFAGLSAARAASIRGASVAILESKADVGAQLRSTGILVKEAAEELDFPRHLARRISGVRLYGPSLRAMDLASPGYYFLATDTGGLLRWLAQITEGSGACLRLGTAFTGAERTDGGFSINGGLIQARYILGADGASSRVARWAGLARNRKFIVGSELELENDPPIDAGFLHCFLDSQAAPGYIGWVIPGVDRLQVGVAGSDRRKPDLNRLIERIDPIFNLKGRRVLGQRRGPIPSGGILKPFATDGVMLIGDAAGMVSPLTAGGIHVALRLGRRAGQAICDHLLEGAPEPSSVLAGELPDYRFKLALRGAMNLIPSNALLDGAISTGWLKALAQKIYFDSRSRSAEANPFYRPAGSGDVVPFRR